MLFSIMHIIHILGVILWIGGLGFITIIVFPAILKTSDPLQKVLQFQRIEHRFAPLARVYNLVVGISGFAMLGLTGWHSVLFTRQGAPLLFMVVIWVFWAVMLFGLEPLVVKKMLDRMASGGHKMDIDGIFKTMNGLHWVLLVISLLASAAGAVFTHGPVLF
jgi:uncharacterized membrane protein